MNRGTLPWPPLRPPCTLLVHGRFPAPSLCHPGLTNSPSIKMEPNMTELRMVAQFKVGDVVWTKASGPWKVVGRWWLKGKQCIAYDLEYVRNRVILNKVVDYEVYASQQHNGTYAGMVRK